MVKSPAGTGRGRDVGAAFRVVNLTGRLNWPKGRIEGQWWKGLVQRVRKCAAR